jgi:hypothetical protein
VIWVLDRREKGMSDLATVVRDALAGREALAREVVAEWCKNAKDVESLALLYRLTYEAHSRIQPPLGQEETCRLIRRYLLECLRLDPQAEGVLGRYEAAQVLLSWFWHLSAMPDTSSTLQEVASAITELYLGGDETVREAIETGFLEHALEEEEYRPLFASWAVHDQLRDAWHSALAWGQAHPGFTRKLLRRPLGDGARGPTTR